MFAKKGWIEDHYVLFSLLIFITKKREHKNWKETGEWRVAACQGQQYVGVKLGVGVRVWKKGCWKEGYRQRLWQLIWGKRPVWHKQRLDTAENLQKYRNLQSMLQVAWQNSFMYARWAIQGFWWPLLVTCWMYSAQSSLSSLQPVSRGKNEISLREQGTPGAIWCDLEGLFPSRPPFACGYSCLPRETLSRGFEIATARRETAVSAG